MNPRCNSMVKKVFFGNINYGNNVIHRRFLFNYIRVFTAAAEIAVDLMWQEDLTHPLCRVLSWHACHLRLTQLLTTQEATNEPETSPADDEEVFSLA